MCVALFPNAPVISEHGLNPGLEVVTPGIIEKVAPLCGIEENCGGVDLMASLLGRLA